MPAFRSIVSIFAVSYQTVVPASFFIQAVEPWGVDVSSLWMLAAYLLGYVAFLLPAFRISEMTGRLASFWFGIVVFVVFTGIAGQASSARSFAIFRAFQGIGAAFIAAMSFLVISTNTSTRSRSLYTGGLCAAQLFGVGVAHMIGGQLAMDGKFRWSIYLAAPLMAAPAILCLPALLADKKPVRTESIATRVLHFDYAGVFLLFGTVLMLTIGLVFGGNEHKWNSAMVVCLIVFGVVNLVVFLLWEKYAAKRPIFNVKWLHEHNLQISVVSILFISIVFFAHSVYVPILYLTVRLEKTDVAGRSTAAYWGTGMGAALLSGLIIRHKSNAARPLVWAGLVISMIFSGLYYTIPLKENDTKEHAFYALAGLGLGLAYPGVSYIAQITVPTEEVGGAAVISHFLSIVGGMLGLILYQACLKSRLIHNLDAVFASNSFLSAFNIRTMDIAGLETAAKPMLVYVPELADKIGQKMIDSLHTTYILSVPFLGFALLTTFLYKHKHAEH
ncbi:hypothetical protein GQ54DRAFT_114649 [Martensiomyces pterosporus]|nr:hypothetical protein GQ54DRAFT_114649 [Martensiomyces pterosporus]